MSKISEKFAVAFFEKAGEMLATYMVTYMAMTPKFKMIFGLASAEHQSPLAAGIPQAKTQQPEEAEEKAPIGFRRNGE